MIITQLDSNELRQVFGQEPFEIGRIGTTKVWEVQLEGYNFPVWAFDYKENVGVNFIGIILAYTHDVKQEQAIMLVPSRVEFMKEKLNFNTKATMKHSVADIAEELDLEEITVWSKITEKWPQSIEGNTVSGHGYREFKRSLGVL